jgi:redox-sensitive bicupin YhaK (pirin superfamily)
VALPRAHEEAEPAFQHHPAESLPAIEREGVAMRLIAGAAYGARAPVVDLSEMFYLDAAMAEGAELRLPEEYPERAAYVVEGAVQVASETFEAGRMIVFEAAAEARLTVTSAARVMLLGGAAMDGERHIWWNFVASTPERIEQARADWRAGRFPEVPDETEFIPLPES